MTAKWEEALSVDVIVQQAREWELEWAVQTLVKHCNEFLTGPHVSNGIREFYLEVTARRDSLTCESDKPFYLDIAKKMAASAYESLTQHDGLVFDKDYFCGYIEGVIESGIEEAFLVLRKAGKA